MRKNCTATCPNCGRAFCWSRPSVPRKFCSQACHYANRKRSPEERFWRLVQKGDKCWLWLGDTGRTGYGALDNANRQHIRAHRFSWELHNGPIPDGLWVLHHCDNPPCVNPAHLFLGTPGDNVADKVAKGRQPRGSAHKNALLTEEQVREIRRLRNDCGWKLKDIGDRFGVTKHTIWAIMKGRNWSHI